MKKRFVQQLDNFINRIACLKTLLQVTHIRDYREKEQQFRIVYINNLRPSGYNGEEPLKYAGNDIKTSKYNIINFIPKNLFEQFRRIANFYFLINIIITLVTPDPPTSPYVSIIPLGIVVIVTAIKQGYEDILRHISDYEINKAKVRVIRNGQFVEIKWSQIRCGDIVEVTAEEDGVFPCDLVLLYANSEDRTCHVTTANLDGETNLKVRRVPNAIPQFSNPLQLSHLQGVLKFDKPNTKLYEFKGTLNINGRESALSNENILLRGTRLKIATLIYGCAIYTGKDTKVMLNSKFKSNKLSSIERRLNYFIIIFLIVLAVMTLISFGLSFIYKDVYNKHWYLVGREPKYFTSDNNLYNFIVLVFYMNLYNYIIPLSMYVTLELIRFIGSQFIQWDVKMYDEKTNEPAKANNSDINEDLGQIEYLFTDKTGTLTENEMIFKQLSIDGVIYEERSARLVNIATNQLAPITDERLMRFLEIMCLCHTIQVDNRAQEKFQASSPDEFCFIKFLERIGISYLGERKDPSSNKLVRFANFLNDSRQYELLHLLDFDSNRKRMSVIVRNMRSGQILLLCKGAEDSLYPICTSGGNVQQCDADISRFAKQGWRTLAFAFKFLSPQELQSIDQLILAAYNDIGNREQRLTQAFQQIETGLTLVGATGIEDRLQDECASTLEALRKAGIKIWVLTGDKRETAINISKSCKHFSDEMIQLIITDLRGTAEIQHRLNMIKARVARKADKETFALVIDGKTLVEVLQFFSKEFLDICLECSAVLCCRMSPAQKADVVRLVKKSKNKPMTAAIGDGANDVSMIQEAHVGFGLYGKEGRNAARSADFSFGKFKFLKRIILIHGYLYYTRTAYLVEYFFYKNLAFVATQFYYAFFNAFSIQSLFNSIVLTFYNITFTSAPIFFFGLFEQRVDMKTLADRPYLYQLIKRNAVLTPLQFLKWNLLGIFHSIVAFFFPYALFAVTNHFSSNGTMGGIGQLGSLVITVVIVIVHVKLLLETHNINLIYVFSIGLSISAYAVFLLIPNAFIMPSPLTSITDDQSLYWEFFDMFTHASIWFCILLAVVCANIPDAILTVFETLFEMRKVNELAGVTGSKQSGYRNNKVSDGSYYNRNFISDDGQKSGLTPVYFNGPNGTYVVTDPNRRYFNPQYPYQNARSPFFYNLSNRFNRPPFNRLSSTMQNTWNMKAPLTRPPYKRSSSSQPSYQAPNPYVYPPHPHNPYRPVGLSANPYRQSLTLFLNPSLLRNQRYIGPQLPTPQTRLPSPFNRNPTNSQIPRPQPLSHQQLLRYGQNNSFVQMQQVYKKPIRGPRLNTLV